METVIEQQLNQDKIILIDGEVDSDRLLAIRTRANELKGFTTHEEYCWLIRAYGIEAGVVYWNSDGCVIFEPSSLNPATFFPLELRRVADFIDAVNDQQKSAANTVQA